MATKNVYPNHAKHYVLVAERWRDDQYFGLVRLSGGWRKTRAKFSVAVKAQEYSFALATRAMRLARAVRRRNTITAQQTPVLRRVWAVLDLEGSPARRLCRLCARLVRWVDGWLRACLWPRVARTEGSER